MRALVFASLCRGHRAEDRELLARLTKDQLGSCEDLRQAETRLLAQYGRRPRLLDLFGGGGMIPIEAARIGADVASVDLNELAVFIQRLYLQRSRHVAAAELAPLVRRSGERVLARLTASTDVLFPLRRSTVLPETAPGPLAYLCTYSVLCPCGYRYHLIRRPWLSRKKGRFLQFQTEEVSNVIN